MSIQNILRLRMYNIKGPRKIVTKSTRRGITQNIETYREHNRHKITEKDENMANVPKPTFSKKCTTNSERHQNISPHHEEIVNFIYESWNEVCAELDQGNCNTDAVAHPSSQNVYYYEDEPCTSLQDFKPFDLESWWGKRLYAFITSTANTNS